MLNYWKIFTVNPRSIGPFYTGSVDINGAKTSWTYSVENYLTGGGGGGRAVEANRGPGGRRVQRMRRPVRNDSDDEARGFIIFLILLAL